MLVMMGFKKSMHFYMPWRAGNRVLEKAKIRKLHFTLNLKTVTSVSFLYARVSFELTFQLYVEMRPSEFENLCAYFLLTFLQEILFFRPFFVLFATRFAEKIFGCILA